MANTDDAADRAAAQAEKLTGGLFKGIKPKVPETDESGTWWERLSVGQSIVMLVSGLNLLFGLFGFFGTIGWIGWLGTFGILSFVFSLINLLIVAFIFYTSFEVKRVRRRSFASLQIVLAALLFALGFVEAIILMATFAGGFGIGYGGIGTAFIGIFWYGAIVGGAILTMANPQLTLNNLFSGSGTTTTASTGQAAQPAPPPPPASKPHIPAANIYVSKAGTTMGPFDRTALDAKLAAGEISRDDLVYADNNQWVPIKDCM
jgi:hypothetical protein